MSFKALKRNSSKRIDELKKAAEAASTNKSANYIDDRFWAPTVDKSGNGFALIRFLPEPAGETVPWARFWDHGFSGPTGRWYIENSLTSIGQPDPVSEYNSELWNSGDESKKEIARAQKRRLHYVSNVYIISDPANPSNNGTVKLFKYGKKIFDKIQDLMNPQFEVDTAVNPFDFWSGADFKLKICKVSGFRNYDKSEFSAPSEFLDGDDTKLEAVYDQLHSLAEFLDPKNYKSYGELKKKLYQVLAIDSAGDIPSREYQSAEKDAPQNDLPEVNEGTDESDENFAPPTEEIENEDGSSTLAFFAELSNSK